MKENVHILNHPMFEHKIAMLRDINTRPGVFRQIVREIGFLEAYEALCDIDTVTTTITTPLEKTDRQLIDGSKLCFVSIMRAGLEMAAGARDLLPSASEGFIAMARDEVTFKPHLSYVKLPRTIAEKKAIILDPMLATAGSSIAAVKKLIEHGVKPYAFCCIIAAPEGIKAFSEAFPDIPLYVGCLDRCLNEKAYILPGLGDAGDRIYGTND